jgi:hypothetical protein
LIWRWRNYENWATPRGLKPSENRGLYSDLRASAGGPQLAASPGPAAKALAANNAATTVATTAKTGISALVGTPRDVANAAHASLPAITPNGVPITSAARASAVACQAKCAFQ